MNRPLTLAAATPFVALVVASNWLTATYGLIGGYVTAGTFTAGLVLLVRDVVRETAGRSWRAWILACIALGAGVSALMTFWAGTFPGGPTPLRLAAASGVAFALSELADTAVYEPLRRRGRLRAAAASQVPGAILDSWVFLALAGFPLWPAVATQTGVKLLMALIPLSLVGGARAVLRHRIRTQGA